MSTLLVTLAVIFYLFSSLVQLSKVTGMDRAWQVANIFCKDLFCSLLCFGFDSMVYGMSCLFKCFVYKRALSSSCKYTTEKYLMCFLFIFIHEVFQELNKSPSYYESQRWGWAGFKTERTRTKFRKLTVFPTMSLAPVDRTKWKTASADVLLLGLAGLDLIPTPYLWASWTF